MKPRLEKYDRFVSEITSLLTTARRQSVRSINAIITATYWSIGKRIVEYEQKGRARAEYGEALLDRLSQDLRQRFGRGFSVNNLQLMRLFYENYSLDQIYQTVSAKLVESDTTRKLKRSIGLNDLATAFPLSWSHYVLLLRRTLEARRFYETEAIRGGWSVRQLERQIESQFYERTALSRNKVNMLKKGAVSQPNDITLPEEEIKNPYVLEFLGLKDEYSESDLEEALIRHLESFLLELGSDFTFVSRQKRFRIGTEWFRVDLMFFHRRLRCLVLIELKLGKFTHAAAGQMHLYLNYAKEHWTHSDENPPLGLILCAEKDTVVARYALDGLPNKIMAAEYRTKLPDEELLARELERSRRALDKQRALPSAMKHSRRINDE